MNFQHIESLVENQFQKIIHMPFLQELQQGILCHKKYIYYLYQDALYLIDYSKALAQTGVALEDTQHIETFYKFAMGAISAERDLHINTLAQYPDIKAHGMSDACLTYTKFLRHHAQHSPAVVSIASILPCFWVYQRVATLIAKNSPANNPYQEWIDAYSSKGFAESTRLAINIFEALLPQTPATVFQDISQAFSQAMELEYEFWESAYRFKGLPAQRASIEQISL